MKVTLKDIAKRAGVSTNTVSLALRNMASVKSDTREQIWKLAEELGYFSQRTKVEPHNICLISTGERLQDSYFYMSFHQHILSKVHEYQYNMMVYQSSKCDISSEELKRNFESNSISGIIILGDMPEEIVSKVVECGIPTIAVGTRYHNLHVCTYIEDNLAGAYIAVHYFKKRGYRKIGFVGRPEHSTGFLERYQGYLGTMYECGLPCNCGQILDMPVKSEYDFRAVAERIRNLPEIPEAFLCANDNIGMVVSKALHALDLSVPKDVALIGFDNSSIGAMAIPSLTTIDVQTSLQADVSVKRLMEFIHSGDYAGERVVLPVELVVRESVGKIK